MVRGLDRVLRGRRGLRVAGAGGMGCAEESNLAHSTSLRAPHAASLRPSVEWNPPIRKKPRMNGAPGIFTNQFAEGIST